MSRSRRNRRRDLIVLLDEVIHIPDDQMWAAMLRVHFEYKEKEEKRGN